jgi:hypothetical protein
MIQNVNEEKLNYLLDQNLRFKFIVDGIGKKIDFKRQVEIIEMFRVFNFAKNVDLINPEIIYRVVYNKGDDTIYFGRQVCYSKEYRSTHEKNAHDLAF